MSVKDQIERIIQHNAAVTNPVASVTLAVRTKTARRVLGIKANEPLEYKGLVLRCIGSKRWRLNNFLSGEQP